MERELPSGPQHRLEAFGHKHRIGLVTLLFTDMAGSTALKQKLGDRAAADLFRRHNDVIRETLRQFPQGEEIETAGDSFLLIFATPSEAVHFALILHERLRIFGEESAPSTLDRIGIHVGEVVVNDDAESQKPKDLFGIQIDTCSRVMSLAQAGQILMTRSVFDSARQSLKGEEIPGMGQLEWLNHGPYVLKGLDESVEICEVREAGKQTGGRPTNSEKAQRQARADEEQVLGWRPAVGQVIPHTRSVLEKKLGEGGFGEVWRGRNSTTKQASVFKFCFQAERVRFLKREMTLFRVLRERVGDHPNIVRLNDVYLDQPPFYMEMEYVEGTDLRSWCAAQGEAEKVPIETRLEIVAQAADGLQAAHEAGIIHRDIKPANILVSGKSPQPGETRVKLTDFGIGQVVSEECLKGITRLGFTQTIMPESSSGRGTHLYMAPELLAGKPLSTRSDLYSLGVVLYQLLVGDFSRPVTTDWTKDILDPLLRDDLQHCFAGKPDDRFVGAAQLARNLRALPERRAELERREAEKATLERAAYRRGIVRATGVAGLIVAVIAGLALLALNESRRAKAAAVAQKQQRELAERHLYAANMNLAQQAWEQNNVGRVWQLLDETAVYPERGFEWNYWERQAHMEIKILHGHDSGIHSVAYSPEGRRIVTGSWDHTAKVWDAVSGKQLLTLKGHAGSVYPVGFSPDGQRIVTGSGDKTAKVWNVSSGKELLTLEGHSSVVVGVAFSPDGKRITTGSHDQTAKVWDASSGKELLTLKGQGLGFESVAYSPNGQQIVTGGWDHTAKVWDAANGKELTTLRGHGAMIWSVSFSPDGQWIVTGSDDQTAKVWDASSGKELLTLRGHSAPIMSVAYSPNGQRIVTGSGDQTAKVWDASSGKELFVLKGHSDMVHSVAYSPDGKRIVTGSQDQTAKLWEASGEDYRRNLKGHSEMIWSVAFSPDGGRVVTGGGDQTAKVWDASSGKELLTLMGHSSYVVCVTYSRDGQRIVTGSRDQTAKVWDASSGKELLTLKGQGLGFEAVAYSPNGQQIVTAGWDQTAKVWDARTGKELLTFKGHNAGIWSVTFSPDNRRVVTGSGDQTAKVWDASSGKELLTLKGHNAAIRSVAHSSNGQRIVTGSEDQTAKVWDGRTGKELLTLNGHSAGVWSVIFSPDDKRIVSASDDQTVKVWDASSGKELVTLKGYNAAIRSVALSPDGQRIIACGRDLTAKVWEAATAQQGAAWQREAKAAAERRTILRQEQVVEVERERALHAQDPGAIKQWLVLAPIAFENRSGKVALEEEQIPQEAYLRPRAGERVTVNQTAGVWSAVRLSDFLTDFDQLLGVQTEWSVAYLVCYIESDADQTGLWMKVGSDDEAKIYLNGDEVYRHAENRPWVPDQDVVTGVALKAGVNVVVFKVVNEISRWRSSLRFTDAAGQPVKGIRVTLNPDVKE